MNDDFLWVEKYRPKTVEQTILQKQLKDTFTKIVESGEIPNMLFTGTAGLGKTTVAKAICEQLQLDYIVINGSEEGNIDTLRGKIKQFASSISLQGGYKVVILDEADYLTPNAQAALRNLMETYSKTTRFILTCNYVEKIIDPIQSRCQTFGITPPSKKDVAQRLVTVLEEKQVEYDIKDVAAIINSSYPDIRRAINGAQSHVVKGKLTLDKNSVVQANYMTKLLELLKNVKDKKETFKQIRQIIADSKVKDFTPLYTFLYDNLDEFAVGSIASCILIIAEAQYTDSHVVDKEINIMSMFVKLMNEL